MIEELIKEVEVSRNLLDTLPKNNIKNKKKYKATLEETKYNYDILLNQIIKEINKRKEKYSKVYEDETLKDSEEKIKFIKDNLFLLNDYNTSYEKFSFDKILYELNHFYRDDLESANFNIFECINIFKKVGIELTKEDFNYSEFANEYMTILLENPTDKDRIKECFEKIYWQCSDVLKHIELNIKYLYYQNQTIFEKYALTLKDKFLKLYDDKILNMYHELVINYDMNKSNSLYIGLNKFLNNELNISDYQTLKIEKCYQMFTDDYKNNFEEVTDEINKIALSSIEYKNYLYFNYIIEDLKKVYKEKENYKNVLKSKLKLIQKKEKVVIAYNKKNKKKSKKEKINIKVINLINELETLYKELDDDIFHDKVYKYLSDDSSIYEALCLACSHYSYIVKCMIKFEKEGSFESEYEKLIEFLLSPYNNVIQNIAITEEKDLPLIISDRYKLSNFKITKENLLTIEGIDEIISAAEKIDIYNKIVLKLSYDNIKFLIDTKDMLK